MAPLPPRPLALFAAALLSCALTFGCRRPDPGPAQLEALKQQYATLLEDSATPDDPRFQAVLEALETIPQDSKAAPEARRLSAAIRGAQRGPPSRPLAPVPPDGEPTSPQEARLRALQQACGRLAEQLGRTAQGGEHTRITAALQRCREQVERAKVTHLHPDEEPGHEGSHVGAHDVDPQGASAGELDAGTAAQPEAEHAH